MSNVKKTILYGSVVICILSALSGIFSLASFYQTSHYPVQIVGVGYFVSDAIRLEYKNKTIASLILGCFALAILCASVLVTYILNKKDQKNENLVNFINIITGIVSVVLAFVMMCNTFAGFDALTSVNDSTKYVSYYRMTFYQMYQSASLSAFIPLFVLGAVILTVYLTEFLKNKKEKKSEEQEIQSEDSDL